jgi:hypothetical protein
MISRAAYGVARSRGGGENTNASGPAIFTTTI